MGQGYKRYFPREECKIVGKNLQKSGVSNLAILKEELEIISIEKDTTGEFHE